MILGYCVRHETAGQPDRRCQARSFRLTGLPVSDTVLRDLRRLLGRHRDLQARVRVPSVDDVGSQDRYAGTVGLVPGHQDRHGLPDRPPPVRGQLGINAGHVLADHPASRLRARSGLGESADLQQRAHSAAVHNSAAAIDRPVAARDGSARNAG
jgi:hypothetical protein